MNNRLYGKLIFELSRSGSKGYSLPKNPFPHTQLPTQLRRQSDANLPECDEMTVARHYTNHSGNNFGVNNGFYPLGSCTMKYNPAINEEMAALPQFTGLHPDQPATTCQGALEVEHRLQMALAEITGMADFTLNPFAGAHGELAGLMIIRAWHQSRGDEGRIKVIVPDSAHGTNPASATMCGLEVVEVKSTAEGRVDVDDLKPLLGSDVAAVMMTNPNTLGLFETEIPEIAKLVHEAGALLYYDGANLNPLLGVCRPGDMGFDVMHVNLHKTFSTPHGGGGPGSGPVGVKDFLVPFLPSPHVVKTEEGYTTSSESPIHVGRYLGNFAVNVRALTYILSLGSEGLGMVGPLATLNANYIKESLKDLYLLPIEGLCKHEFVFDGLRDKSTGVTTMHIAKRLLDYGFHAPTIYFPLLFHESLMIEPTECESLATLDEFIAIMRHIAEEAQTQPDVVKDAPQHTPVGKVDDVLAATCPILTYKQLMEHDNV